MKNLSVLLALIGDLISFKH